MSGFACLGSDSDDESKAAPVFNFGAATLGAAPALTEDTLEPVTAPDKQSQSNYSYNRNS